MADETELEAARRAAEQGKLDVEHQRQVVKELSRLQAQFGITFLSHARAVMKLQALERLLTSARARLRKLTGD